MFKKVYIHLLNFCLYRLSRWISKDENIWLFGCWFGNKYADNVKYLFEYVTENHSDTKAIWITSDDKVYEFLKDAGVVVYKKYSLGAIYYGLKAGVSIFSHSNLSDLMPFLNNKTTKLVQLWHGMPLKKIGMDDQKYSYTDKTIKYNSIKEKFFPYLLETYDLFIASSEEDKKIFEKAFNCKKVAITGYPRNDSFYRLKNNKSVLKVMYLPTFRGKIGEQVDFFTDYGFDFEKWERTLSENNIRLEIKMHPVNKPSKALLEQFEQSKCCYFIDEVDITEILPDVDILISDYSSVFFDYLLTDNPIIFAPFDYESYLENDRELYYDYDTVTPGPKCKDWTEVLDWILKYSIHPELYLESRENVRNRVHKYQDGNSSYRVYYEIKNFY
ncbi:CDP-glycerol glycerophosphotransferase family protein [Lonepinella sp. BR2882]|uniref:CDP-glycerol glycerophosphotransferase family protein n=1 Tax=Lonepinella sp. BR2882 TaxID=3095283 RepID=UPI003F6DE89A